MQPAHLAVLRAVNEGQLQPARQRECKVCGGRAQVLHHWSYEPEHWLDVSPLCRKCHGLVHSGKVPDPISGRNMKRPYRPRPPTPNTVADRVIRFGNRRPPRSAYPREWARALDWVDDNPHPRTGFPTPLAGAAFLAYVAELRRWMVGLREAMTTDHVANARAQLARWSAEGVQRPPWVRR